MLLEGILQVEADLVSKAEASSALLAFHLCMSRFDLAIEVAEQLEDSEVRKLVEEWDAEAQQLLGLYRNNLDRIVIFQIWWFHLYTIYISQWPIWYMMGDNDTPMR